jgi:hypothetical protein
MMVCMPFERIPREEIVVIMDDIYERESNEPDHYTTG